MTPTLPADAAGQRGGYGVVAVIAWIVLALSLGSCVLWTWVALRFAHEGMCEPGESPVVFRESMAIAGLALWLASVVPAALLLVRGKRAGVVVALLLALLSLAIPFVTLLIPVFLAGLC